MEENPVVTEKKFYYLRNEMTYNPITGNMERVIVFVDSAKDEFSFNCTFSNVHGNAGEVIEIVVSKFDLKTIE